jgi:hypothetical protein
MTQEPEVEYENAICIEENEIQYYYIPDVDIFYKTYYNTEDEQESLLLYEKGKELVELSEVEISYIKLCKENSTINV